MEEELGQPIERVFSKISALPVAAASLGQVYRATLRESGEEVAIKVRIPTPLLPKATHLHLPLPPDHIDRSCGGAGSAARDRASHLPRPVLVPHTGLVSVGDQSQEAGVQRRAHCGRVWRETVRRVGLRTGIQPDLGPFLPFPSQPPALILPSPSPSVPISCQYRRLVT